MNTATEQFIETKNCEVCGIVVHRDKKLSQKQWNRKRYCSFECGGKALNQRMDGYSFRRGKKFAVPRKCSACSTVSERVTFYEQYSALLCDRHYMQMSRHGRILWDEWVKRSPLARRIRTCTKYKVWRTAVYERDDYTCVQCGNRGCELAPDHIVPFAVILKLHGIETLQDAHQCDELWDVGNGRTLCRECHLKTPTFGRNVTTRVIDHLADGKTLDEALSAIS